MTEPQDSHYHDDWIKMARKDFRRINVLLKDEDAEGAAFFLQQSLEKYLKAFLLQKSWKLKKIHDLDTLLDYAAEFQYFPKLSLDAMVVCVYIDRTLISGTRRSLWQHPQ